MPRYRSKSWRNYRPGATPVDGPTPSDGLAPPDGLAPMGRTAPLMAATDCRILGIDPGSRRLGFGVIDVRGPDARCVAHGRIEVEGLPMVARLVRLHAGVRELVEVHRPQEIAVEKVFVNRNVDSALKLGQARGAALAALGGLEIAEYAPRAIKLATVGFGGADKLQVAHMMRAVLEVEGRLTADAADALAVALCHAQHRRLAGLLAGRDGGAQAAGAAG
jgi:crossover junction endodeoxyribonuclease RuvC